MMKKKIGLKSRLRRILLGRSDSFDDLEGKLVEFFKDAIGWRELEEWQMQNVNEIVASIKRINELSYGIADY